MASFLQNHGDIILDAVLTDYGRKLLAKGDGSFNIAKFAFADDEIDYTLYDVNEPSLSRDTEIMKTPIMEAVTNNAASMKSPLLTIAMENILFMPSMKLNLSADGISGSFNNEFTGFIIPVDSSNNLSGRTTSYLTKSANDSTVLDGVLNSANRRIIVDNGIDSDKLSYTRNIKEVYPMMYETQFNVYVDNRFASIGQNVNGILSSLTPLSVDDDSVAIYRITNQTSLNNKIFVNDISTSDTENTPIKGVRGTRIEFTLNPTLDLSATDTMFNRYGKIKKLKQGSNQDFLTIRSSVTVEGINTGCSIEIPVLFAKVSI